jgi:hypothetical protein
MAHNSDSGNQINITSHEQTSLLEDHQSDYQQSEENENENGYEQNKLGWYIWRIFWTIVAALVLVIYIKGWIDAGGDVDVSVTTLLHLQAYCPADPVCPQFDLKGAFLRALGGGLSGAAAMVLQVLLLMVRISLLTLLLCHLILR